MLLLKPSIVNRQSIKNIIFDFGGVICNIDVKLTEQAFINLGLKQFDTDQTIADSKGLFERLEVGTITPEQFRDELRNYFVNPVSDEEIDQAWNALLLDIPEPRIRLIEKIRDNYRIFLLSNTNEIHYRCYAERFRKQFGYAGFDSLFEKAWLSHHIGLKKPSVEIFRHVMLHSRLNSSETLFIDDTLRHVEGARKAGLYGWHLDLSRGDEIMELFEKQNP